MTVIDPVGPAGGSADRKTRLGASQIRRGRLYGKCRRLSGLARGAHVGLALIHLLRRREPVLGERPRAGQLALGLGERGGHPLLLRTEPAQGRPGRVNCRARFRPRAGVEQRRRLRMQASHDIASPDLVARLELDAPHPSSDRRRYDEPVPYPGFTFFVDAHHQWPATDRCHVDRDRFRPQRNGHKRSNHRRRQEYPPIEDELEHRHYSRVLSTPTRSNRSSRRRTTRPDRSDAAMTTRNVQATVAADTLKLRR